MKNDINVFINVYGNGRLPQYASKHAAGCDLFATEDMVIRPGETKIMPLNFSMAIEPEMEAQIRPRSGLSLKTQLRIPNGPGTIDSDYRDSVGVILQNTYNIANLPYQIAQNPGLLQTLLQDYKEVELSVYLSESRGKHCFADNNGKAGPSDVILNELSYHIDNPGSSVNSDVLSKPAILSQRIYIDRQGNPYGTIYIKQGERIAQMIFCEYKRAFFIPHDDPRSIGEDRGGGFGHTGKD